MRILELFSGIGAVSVAVHGKHEIACAIDINQVAMQVYQANFSSPTRIQEIASISDHQFAEYHAELWWLSPPCQPFTRRGLQKDTEDPRSAALLRVVNAIPVIRPRHIALENVIGFEHSNTHRILIAKLEKAGYHLSSLRLCSSEFGVPNLRPRYFLAASLDQRPHLRTPQPENLIRTVSEYLECDNKLPEGLGVSKTELQEYCQAINIVEADSGTTRCFTSAYGKSNVRSGSYLETSTGFRRFSPREIARLLGFPDRFLLPSQLSTRQSWKLLGNAVSVHCVKHVLSSLGD